MASASNGNAVRELRIATGWKLGEFAREVKISPGYLCNIEAGRKDASPPVLRRIADTLDVPLVALTVGGETKFAAELRDLTDNRRSERVAKAVA